MAYSYELIDYGVYSTKNGCITHNFDGEVFQVLLMILKELQNYVLERHCVSLADMEQHFRMDGDALRSMLDKLIRKRRVNKLPMAVKCQSCTSCDRDTLEFYEWNDGAKFSLDRATPQDIELYVEDLHCQMCISTVREALQKVSGVKRVKVNLSQKKITAEMTGDRKISVDSLIQALEKTGYEAKPITTAKLK